MQRRRRWCAGCSEIGTYAPDYIGVPVPDAHDSTSRVFERPAPCVAHILALTAEIGFIDPYRIVKRLVMVQAPCLEDAMHHKLGRGLRNTDVPRKLHR